MKPHHYAEIAAFVFAAEGTFAIVHRILGYEYAGFSHLNNVVVDVGLAVTWLAAATAMTVRRTFSAFFVAVLGACASLFHGSMFSVLSPHGAGIPFLLAAFVLALTIKRSVPAWRIVDDAARRPAPRVAVAAPLAWAGHT